MFSNIHVDDEKPPQSKSSMFSVELLYETWYYPSPSSPLLKLQKGIIHFATLSSATEQTGLLIF